MGVPRVWIETVKSLRSSEDLIQLIGKIPDEAWERLVDLANGERAPAHSQRLLLHTVDPFEHPDSRRRFVKIKDEVDIRRLFSDRWQRWQIFLHPSQRAVVEAEYSGPALVSGEAGTGKSVIAVHRAVWLARRSERARILLTTFSKKLAKRLAQLVEQLLVGERARRRIEVVNIDKKLRQLACQYLGNLNFVEQDRLSEMLRASAEREGFGKEKSAFIQAEWERVIDFWGIDTEDEYVEASREGRAVPLSSSARRRLWPVFARVIEELRDQGCDTWSRLAAKVAAALERSGWHPFDHVIVDEAQDFGPQQLRVVRLLVAPGRNDILLLGDWGQQIYKPRFSWMSLGIDVRGRSTRLKVCYRTTWQILRFADRIWFANGPNEPENARDGLAVCDGPVPIVKGTRIVPEQIEVVAKWLECCRKRAILPEHIAIVARTKAILRQIGEPAVSYAGLQFTYEVDEYVHDRGRVSLLTMHDAKGMEFRAVAVVGCSREYVPLISAMRQAERAKETEDALRRERNLLYVALTRPRELLLITWSGEPSVFLKPVL
ncbi:MAG: UvrD-helicase domain-containing protein [Geminicoccaceae bacterium]|nr:UvrD-helicase domain-containing protein [Geminicoccaceae bacterium]